MENTLMILGIYFAPCFIAWSRGHNNALAIFAMTLLLGWTAIGWVAALIWSLASSAADKRETKIW